MEATMASKKTAKIDPKKTLWDLNELAKGKDDPKIDRNFKAFEKGAKVFSKKYRGKVSKLGPAAMLTALKELERIDLKAWDIMVFAQLEFSTKANDPEWGAFVQGVQERLTQASSQLEFFKVEWTRVAATKAKKLAADPKLARYRHFLEHAHSYKKHTLKEGEEIIASKMGQVGQGAWSRYYGTVLSDVEYKFRGKTVTESEITGFITDPDRSKRRDASSARIKGLKANAKPLTFAFNMVLAGKMVGDDIRDYEHWVQSRNKSNEIPDSVVDALVTAMQDRKDIMQRYYRMKKKLLGVSKLMSYDTFAPLPTDKAGKMKFETAVDMVSEVFHETRPSFGKIADDMFAKKHVDVPPYKGKRGGAFCMPNMSGTPYVLLNWTGKMRDTATLAHEFGHAVHMELSRKRGPMGGTESLVMAEVASVFMETLLYNKLLNAAKNPKERLTLLRQIIEDGIATTFRQLQFNRFEDRVHNARRESGELSTAQICDHFRGAEKEFFGNAMTPHAGAENFWMYVQHFVNVPGYVYAYCASYLVVLALYKRYLDEGKGFLVKYEKMLAAGGSQTPEELLGALGVDWTDPAFWLGGLEVFEDYINQFEATAKELKLM